MLQRVFFSAASTTSSSDSVLRRLVFGFLGAQAPPHRAQRQSLLARGGVESRGLFVGRLLDQLDGGAAGRRAQVRAAST